MSAPPPGDAAPAYDTKWWGWGDAGKRAELAAGARERLREELGIDAHAAAEPVPLESIELPEPRPIPRSVLAAVGDEQALTGLEDRVRHAAGGSYPDLIRLRKGELGDTPDAVLLPADREQVAAALEACGREGVAVVPFGGGTSVVGGVDPVRGDHECLISLDLRRLRDVSLDEISMTARLGPGLRGPEAEAALAQLGVNLGHYPQSYEYATIGGFAATRSAGQASCGYGRFDDMVTAIELQAPEGRPADPGHAAYGRRALAARAGRRLRGHARRDHGGELPRPSGTAAPDLRGLDGAGLRLGLRDRPGPRPARRDAGRVAPLR